MYIRNKGLCHIEYYNGVSEFLDVVESRPYNDHAETRRIYHDRRFTGVSSYDEARELLVHGYKKPVKIMDGVKVADDELTNTPRYYNDVVGSACIVPLALQGIPTCMINRQPRPRVNPIVKLLVDVGRGGCVERRQIETYGKNIVSLVRALELNGRRVQIDVLGTCCLWNNDPLYAFRFPIKRASEPLDIKRICFPLLHSAFQRVFKFDWFDRLPDSKPVWGYGSATCYHYNDPRERELYIDPLLEDGETLIHFNTDFNELKTRL